MLVGSKNFVYDMLKNVFDVEKDRIILTVNIGQMSHPPVYARILQSHCVVKQESCIHVAVNLFRIYV